MFSDLEINGGEGYVPYVSQDPLSDPKSFTFRIKVYTVVFRFKQDFLFKQDFCSSTTSLNWKTTVQFLD